MSRFVSGCCEGERCWCGAPAEHKVGEEIQHDDPRRQPQWVHFSEGAHRVVCAGHELTAYVCHEHFRQLMGPAADREGG